MQIIEFGRKLFVQQAPSSVGPNMLWVSNLVGPVYAMAFHYFCDDGMQCKKSVATWQHGCDTSVRFVELPLSVDQLKATAIIWSTSTMYSICLVDALFLAIDALSW
jgi:hypothetical protein